MTNFKILASALIFTAIQFTLSGCGGSDTQNTITTQDPTTTQVVISDAQLGSDHGSAGTTVAVKDYNISECKREDISINVGEEQVIGFVVENNTLHFSAPLFYDEAIKWSNPPKEALDVSVKCGDKVVVFLPKSFTVTTLVHAPGTMEEIKDTLISQIEHLKEINTKIIISDSPQEQYMYAYLNALENLISGDKEHSIDSLIASLKKEDPQLLDFFDALVSSSGPKNNTEVFNDMLAELEVKAQDLPLIVVAQQKRYTNNVIAYTPLMDTTTSPSATLPLPDKVLAFQMQYAHMLKLFGKEVIADTASRFATISSAISALGIAGIATPIGATANATVGVINVLLSIYDIVLNQAINNILPSKLDDISLSVEPNVVGLGDTLKPRIEVTAFNQPEPMTLEDLTSVILTGMSIVGFSPNLQERERMVQILEEEITVLLDLVRTNLSTYAQYNAGSGFMSNYNNALATPPSIRYRAQGTTPKLYQVIGSSTTIIEQIPNQLEWRASYTQTGSVKLELMPSQKEDARFVSYLPPYYIEYLGGAFGLDSIPSNKAEVKVVEGNFFTDVKGDSCMHAGDQGTLTVKTGYMTSDNMFTPSANTDISITITGGISDGAVLVNAVTNINGEFSIPYTPNGNENDVLFSVNIINPSDQSMITKTFSTSVQYHCELGIMLSISGCFKKDESTDVIVTVGEPQADGSIQGYGNIDLAFRLSRGTINGGIGIATTNNDGQVTLPLIPESDTGGMDLWISAGDMVNDLYAEKTTTIPVGNCETLYDGNITADSGCDGVDVRTYNMTYLLDRILSYNNTYYTYNTEGDLIQKDAGGFITEYEYNYSVPAINTQISWLRYEHYFSLRIPLIKPYLTKVNIIPEFGRDEDYVYINLDDGKTQINASFYGNTDTVSPSIFNAEGNIIKSEYYDYTLDNLGRVIKQDGNANTANNSIFTYDSNDNIVKVTSIKYPSFSINAATYDSYGNMTLWEGSEHLREILVYTYNSDGKIQLIVGDYYSYRWTDNDREEWVRDEDHQHVATFTYHADGTLASRKITRDSECLTFETAEEGMIRSESYMYLPIENSSIGADNSFGVWFMNYEFIYR